MELAHLARASSKFFGSRHALKTGRFLVKLGEIRFSQREGEEGGDGEDGEEGKEGPEFDSSGDEIPMPAKRRRP